MSHIGYIISNLILVFVWCSDIRADTPNPVEESQTFSTVNDNRIKESGEKTFLKQRGSIGSSFKNLMIHHLLFLVRNEDQKEEIGPMPREVPSKQKTLFPQMTDENVWQRLPRKEPALPSWARMLAESLPKTVAGMLELDTLHREENPLGKKFAAQLRWMVANANHCDYAKAYAEFDLKNAGVSPLEIKRLAHHLSSFTTPEQKAFAFAKKLSREGFKITDEEVAELIRDFGAEKMVAIVHTVAFANFQNRIFFGLQIKLSSYEPVPAIPSSWDFSKPSVAKSRESWAKLVSPVTVQSDNPLTPLENPFEDLQKKIANQKLKKIRIPMPPPETLDRLPPEVKKRTVRINWSRVSMGYQPKLTHTWFACMDTFHSEAKMNSLFNNSMFWLITQSNQCFY